MDSKYSKKKKPTIAKKVFFVIVVCAILFSALLAFCIPHWAVLIINGGAIVVYRILFRKLQFSAIGGILLYLLVGLITAGVLALIMLYPEKLYGGVPQDESYAKNYNDILIVSCCLFAIIYLIQGIWVIVDAVRTNDVLLPFHCIVPISLIGGLMIYLMIAIVAWIVYVIVVGIVNILCSVLCEEDGPENWGSGAAAETVPVHIIYVFLKINFYLKICFTLILLHQRFTQIRF